MSSPKENEGNFKAGHARAGFVAGKRVSTREHKSSKDTGGLSEDITGLKVAGSPPKTTISGAIPKGHADFPPEAVQIIHKEKPAAIHAVKPQINIQQPRK